MKKITAIALLFVLIFSPAACGKAVDTTADATAASDTVSQTQSELPSETLRPALGTAQEETTPKPSRQETQATKPAVTTTPASAATTLAPTTVPKPALPNTKAEILAQYTKIMNQAKAEKPAFTKIQYQDLPKDKRHADGLATSVLSQFIDQMFTSEKDARNNPTTHAKGNDMQDFPVVQSEKGCCLTDANLIKSATLTQNGGTRKIRIVLKDEKNAGPYWATKKGDSIGGIFDLARKEDLDDALKSIPVIREPQYSLTYYDCTAELEYDTATGHIISLKQTTHALADASFKMFSKNTLDFVVDDYTIITVRY
ncbi:MAG: hypothetical protein LBJ12_00170 [Oscillospiraceae bacterium]|jgi:hypothetical protein|nr:hypothetical protein [Oscillospiraceae bacterium]